MHRVDVALMIIAVPAVIGLVLFILDTLRPYYRRRRARWRMRRRDRHDRAQFRRRVAAQNRARARAESGRSRPSRTRDYRLLRAGR